MITNYNGMDIYFVRHGQTYGNAAKRHQHDNSRLTDRGKQQAVTIAKAIAAYQPTHLVVSNRVRAVETGVTIAAETELVPRVTELVAELNRPHHLYGNYHRSPMTFWYLARWFFGNLGDVGDAPEGESYAALRDRIEQTKVLLTEYPADARVVVVSHSVFINMFVAHLHQDAPLQWWRGLYALVRSLLIRNGSLTHVTYDPAKGWQLQSFGKVPTSPSA